MGRILNNVNHGPGLLKRLGRIVAASVAAVATLAGGMLVAGTANAATAQGPGYWFNPFNSGLVYAGHHGFALGVQGTRNGRPAYCIQIGVAGIDTNAGTWADATDATSKVAAYMVDKERGRHERFDPGGCRLRDPRASGRAPHLVGLREDAPDRS